MRQLIAGLLITILGFGIMVSEASAKRFGGGRSFGVQRSSGSLFNKQRTMQSTPAAARNANTSRWGGMLGGLLVGGLLASLFMGHGVLNGLMTWLLLGAALYFLVSFFRRKMQPGLQGGQQSSFKANPSFSDFTKSFSAGSSNSNFSEYPAGFIPENFLRSAKVNFIRLQAAYDQKNLDDLTQFTAPEVFAELKMQLDERGDEPNKTEVINLDAELLDVSKETFSTLASIRFTGMIKENDEPAANFSEIWHFRSIGTTDEWVVAGIQQEA